MAPIVEIMSHEELTLGEGPHWDEELQCLYYVDIFGQTIHKYVPSTNTHTEAAIEGGPVSLILPVKGTNDQFLITVERKVVVVTWDGKSPKVSKTELLLEIEAGDSFKGNRINDGKADPVGRLWTGTMGPEPELGKWEMGKGGIYSITGRNKVQKHVSQIGLSNGLAWNTSLNKMYYIDSLKKTVDEYDYDINKGEIKNCKVIFDFEKNNIPGLPDGMTIDSEGNLWVAVFDGGRILHINPSTSELINAINFPVKQITSCAFGGPNMDVLYVTSAKLAIKGVEQPTPAGACFKVTGTGCTGMPGFKIDLDLLE